MGVMVQGSGQMGELLGRRRRPAAVAVAAVAAVTWKLGSETVLVFGPESVSYERSRHENWTILREISARVFFVKIPKIKKNHISNISRIWENWKNQTSNISRIGLNQKNSVFQYFQDSGECCRPRFPICPGGQ